MKRQILVAVEGVWSPSAFKRRTQCLAFCNRSDRVAVQSCRSRAMRSYSMISFSPMMCSATALRYSSCLDFLGISFAFNMILLFRLAVLWSSSGILLNVIALGFLFCCRTPRVLQISPKTATNDPDFGESIAIKTLMSCRSLAMFQDFCVVHVDEREIVVPPR